ncbi:hypothetical protein [Cellulosimicrobium sp. Marseille-Q4280]|uniref:hypothetical protein n=1 Tax=Cellulosimicrobium sp. Marseille-Q4280 TaxID=2937992 RepID=UPI0020419132|nr:hypothetical protein [Cellulosimicrobium sp. Marseille-Q4280]
MGKVATGVALLAVVGVLGAGALVPDAAAGLSPRAAATELSALRAAVGDLPDALAAEPRVAFSLGSDGLAAVDMTFGLELNGSAGYVVDDAVLEDPVEVEPGHRHEGESSSAGSDAGGEAARAYAFVSTRAATQDPDVYVRVPPVGATDDVPEAEWDTIRVTCDTAQETHPVLASDLTRVAYSTDASGDTEIVVADARSECAGDDAVALAPDADAEDLWPSWGPGDASLFFSSTRDDPLGDLYAVGLEQGGTSARAADAATAVARATGPPVRLTDDAGADTMPDVVVDAQGSTLVLFTTTRFRPGGSVASFSLPYFWSPGGSVEPGVVSDPWAEADGAVDGPAVGREPRARVVTLDDAGPAVLLAYTATDEGSGRPSAWVALLRGQGGALEVDAAWRVPSSGQGGSHPDWVTVRPMQGGFSSEPEQETVPGSARLRFTQRSEERVVADAPAAGSGTGDAGVRQLTGGPGAASRLDDAGPAYAPDGGRLAFSALLPGEPPDGPDTALREIAVVDPTTRALSTLVPRSLYGMANPDWSPDGARVAYSGIRGSEESIGVGWVDVGTGAEDWTRDEGSGGWAPLHPSWSPDGEWLVAEAGRVDDEDDVTRYLGVLELASRTWTPLTVDVVEDCWRYTEDVLCDVASEVVQGREPAWSPDGTQVAVVDLRIGGVEVAPGGISVLDVEPADLTDGDSADDVPVVVGLRALTGFDHSALVRTTQPPVREGSAEPDPGPTLAPTPSRARVALSDGPAWSTDGTEVVFSGQPAGRPDDRDLYAVAPDGSGLRTVLDLPAALTEPDVQPVGDLSLRLTADPVRLDLGTTTTVTATVTNTGRTAAAPTVVLVLPPGLRPGDLPPGCVAEPGTGTGSTVVTCTTRNLGPGDETRVAVPVVAERSGVLDVVGAVVNPGPEADVEDNLRTVSLTVADPDPVPGGDADLFAEVAVSAPRAWVGGRPVDVTVTVRNTGTATATDVVLVAEHPAGVSPSDAGPTAAPSDAGPTGLPAGGECLGAWGTCPIADLAPGAEVTVVSALAPVGPAARGAVTVTVTGRTGTPDPFTPLTSPVPLPAPTSVTTSAGLEVVQPWLRVLPAVAAPGDVVLAYGEDFPPGEDAVLTWSAGITSASGPYRVGPDGRLSVPVLIVRNDLRGERWLRVTSGDPPPLTTPRVVDASSSDPSAGPVPPCPGPPGTPSPSELAPGTSTPGPAWCEVDGAVLVVTPTVAVPDTQERR